MEMGLGHAPFDRAEHLFIAEAARQEEGIQQCRAESFTGAMEAVTGETVGVEEDFSLVQRAGRRTRLEGAERSRPATAVVAPRR